MIREVRVAICWSVKPVAGEGESSVVAEGPGEDNADVRRASLVVRGPETAKFLALSSRVRASSERSDGSVGQSAWRPWPERAEGVRRERLE